MIDQQKIDDVRFREYNLDIGNILTETINLLKSNILPIISYSSSYLIISFLLLNLGYTGMILQAIIAGPFIAGFYHGFYLSYTKKEALHINDFTVGLANPLKYIQVSLLSGIIAALGIWVFVIPGIYFFTAYFFAIPFALFFEYGVWEALESSRILITKKFWHFLALLAIAIAANLLGALLYGLGLIFTLPFTYALFFVAFSYIFPEMYSEVESNDTQEDINMDIFR